MNIRRLFATALLLCASSAALAAYPDKPIKVIVGFAAGGGSDILIRTITPGLSEVLGVPVVVDNLPGAGGNRAMAEVARAKPDGYTLLMGTPGLATNSSLYANLGFDPEKDFAPVGLVGSVQNVLIVRPSLDAKTVGELITLANKEPGKLNYASPGTGTSQHLAGELFKHSTQIKTVHVPYKGGGQAMSDLMSGQVDYMFNVLPSALPQIKAGTVRAIAVTGGQRSDTLPDVPTMIESGVAGYTAVTWNGIVAPAGTPPDVVDKLNKAIAQVLSTPEMKQRYAAIGTTVLIGSPDDFAKLIRDETAKWQRTIKASGIKAE